MPPRELSKDDVRFVLQSAVLAPSADNRLPIRFRITNGAIAVRFAGASLPRPRGYREMLLLLSVGALAENAVVGASQIGKRLRIEVPPDLRSELPLLTLASTGETTTPDPLYEQLERRQTNRSVIFRGPPLSTTEGQAIVKDCALPEGDLHWLNNRATRASVVQHMTRAEAERFRNPTLHEELFSAIRFDVGWRTSCSDGLPPGALQIEAPARPLFQLLRHWPIARVANRLGTARVFGIRSCRLPCSLAPDLGAVTVERLDTDALVQAGRMFQRIWLELSRLGRVLQPLPAGALYALPEARNEGVPQPLQRELADAWHRLFDGRHPVMFFRSGRAQPSKVRAERLPVEAHLDDASEAIGN